eukprot:NODE_3764_length_734_cov_79.871533_g3167_i0.p1 GENE.NODE_3764_length_734_cov_79.871533_g3167_i0~~NODE_3764_length_734_cov_79.871533_g3167_i0.p1  ORF type:complete len:95 (-),score=9.35 NODE_3764_length_734_cov_79.871533_g3167_i0:369-653(-)
MSGLAVNPVQTVAFEGEATIDRIKELQAPTDRFLCSLGDNVFNIRFCGFRIRDMISNLTLVNVDEDGEIDISEQENNPADRLIRYHFGPDFLRL